MNLKNRRYNWVSSSDTKNSSLLNNLNDEMIKFYSKSQSRDFYQEMLDSIDNDLSNPGITTKNFIDLLKTIKNDNILEVGCGSGRIYQYILQNFPKSNYNGIELSDKVISSNVKKYPKAKWMVAGAYDIPVASESQDICCSFYVLEHLVYPEKALNEMLRILKKGGRLVLIFPDFISSKKLASQTIGLSDYGTPKTKLKKGKIIDTLVSIYDARVGLPNAMANAAKKVGEFPVNINPICLHSNVPKMSPDIDAVYLASKIEIQKWAVSKGHEVFLPFGDSGHFDEHAFVVVKKS